MKTYKFGIIGCGMIAHIHASAIKKIEGGEVYGVYDPILEKAEGFAAKHKCKVYLSVEEMMKDRELNIINICTPSGTHADLAITAAQAGKHVVVEKPLAVRTEDAQAVVDAQEENGTKVCVISQLRFSPGVQTARNAVQKGQLGKLIMGGLSMRYYRSEEYYRNGAWRGKWDTDGGGALMNQGIHGLDILTYICGPVVSVRGFFKTLLHDIEVEDTLCAILEFKNGALGTVEASTAIKPGSARRIEIGGTEGSITLKEDVITEWNAKIPLPDMQKSWDMNAANNPAAIDATGHQLQFENLIGAIEGKVELLVDARAGYRMVELINGIYTSARSGNTVYFEVNERDT